MTNNKRSIEKYGGEENYSKELKRQQSPMYKTIRNFQLNFKRVEKELEVMRESFDKFDDYLILLKTYQKRLASFVTY